MVGQTYQTELQFNNAIKFDNEAPFLTWTLQLAQFHLKFCDERNDVKF